MYVCYVPRMVQLVLCGRYSWRGCCVRCGHSHSSWPGSGAGRWRGRGGGSTSNSGERRLSWNETFTDGARRLDYSRMFDNGRVEVLRSRCFIVLYCFRFLDSFPFQPSITGLIIAVVTCDNAAVAVAVLYLNILSHISCFLGFPAPHG